MTTKKLIRRLTKRFIALGAVGYLYWSIPVILILTGFYDAMRQKNEAKGLVLKQYFLGNGALTWAFSPLNTFIDMICLPYLNKQVYQLSDLPEQHQREIKTILEECPNKQLTAALKQIGDESERTMLFYKWYGFNVDNDHPCPLFHRDFKRILTIGISDFKAQAVTTKHFGWLRAGIRVLINIDDDVNEQAYIDVNNIRHVWKTDGPIFIFDDTVLHQSFNLGEKNRSCLFIDITRPSLFPFIINGMVRMLGLFFTKVKYFSNLSKWNIVK